MPTLVRHRAGETVALLDEIAELYAEVYAEPPYEEGPQDVADFCKRFVDQTRRPGFSLVTAHVEGELAGFVFGFTLQPESLWWKGLLTSVPENTTTETGRRTVAIIELLVRGPRRRRGIATLLLNAFLEDRHEERATLLVRPEAAPAQALYTRLGWRKIGRLRPFAGAPVYNSMILPLMKA